MVSIKVSLLFATFVAIVSCDLTGQPTPNLIAFTRDGSKCVTECVAKPDGKKWCHIAHNVNSQCTISQYRASQFFTSMSKTKKPNCLGDCTKSAQDGFFKCLTSVTSNEWDYCSPYNGVSYMEEKCTGACVKNNQGTYHCETNTNFADKRRFCSPPPKEYVKENIRDRKTCKRPALRKEDLTKLRRGQDHVNPNNNKVSWDNYYDMNSLLHRAETNNTVRTIEERNRPEITYSTSRHNGVDVLHSMRARLTKNTIPNNEARVEPPSGHQNRMKQLHKINSDDVGHVLSPSLGGPNTLINIIPHHSAASRNSAQSETAFNYWRQTESYIRWMVMQSDTQYVDLKVYLFYEGSLDNEANRRPVGFGFRYSARFSNGDSVDSSDCTFENNNVNADIYHENVGTTRNN
jgi:hypothetical protein